MRACDFRFCYCMIRAYIKVYVGVARSELVDV